MTEKLNFFSHEKISERLYIITEGYSMVHRFTIGVIVGDEKVLVIDSGMAMGGNLREEVEALVGKDKPILCACTHCHPDHVGSAKLFDKAYCSYLDWPARSDFAFGTQQRLEDLHGFALDNQEVQAYAEQHMLINTDTTFQDIKDGDVFDLGGVKILAIGLPGHSLGSMAFYNAEEDYVFTGDAVNTDTHLKKLDKEGFAAYRESLMRFISIVGETARVYPAHLPLTMNMEVAKNLVRCCDDLIAGNVVGDPPGETIFVKRSNNPDIRMHFRGNTCIVYNRRLIGCGESASDYLNFYSHEKITDRIYVVTENYSMVHRFTIGVIVGDEKVLVIDSGLGMDADLRTYIEGVVGTDKPMLCACTHGAIDHAGAACLFDEAFLNPRDNHMLESAFDPARRLRDLGAFSLFNNEVIAYGKAHMLDNRNSKFTPVDEGDVFDLGGIQVYPIRTPGHSKGHLAYYIPSEKIAFAGDGINADTHIKKLDNQGLLDYRDMLYRFLSIVGDDITIYAGHLNRAHKANVIRNLAQACEDVAEGRTAGDPPGETIFLEKAGNPAIRMHYSGNSCIIYNAGLLRPGDVPGRISHWPQEENGPYAEKFRSFHQYLSVAHNGMMDLRAFLASDYGKAFAARLEERFRYEGDAMGSDVMAYYEKLGLKKEMFASENYYERWVLLTPLEMYTQAGRGKKYPLVFSHHGGGSSIETDEFSTGYNRIAGREKFMVAYLQNSNWDNTLKILDYIGEHYPLDRERVYVSGFSQGGYQTHSVYFRAPERLTAVAPCGNDIMRYWDNADVRYTDEEMTHLKETFLPFFQMTGGVEASSFVPLTDWRPRKDWDNVGNPETWIDPRKNDDLDPTRMHDPYRGYRDPARMRKKQGHTWSQCTPPTPPEGRDIHEWMMERINKRMWLLGCAPRDPEKCLGYLLQPEDTLHHTIGIYGDREEIRTYYGYRHYVVDIDNADGIHAFRYITVENSPHWPYVMMGELAWEFFRKFRRDTKTGKIVQDTYRG